MYARTLCVCVCVCARGPGSEDKRKTIENTFTLTLCGRASEKGLDIVRGRQNVSEE